MTPNIPNIPNIEKMADLLEKDAAAPKVTFNMTMWGIIYNLNKPYSCETTCCAIGLAALSGEFPELRYTFSRRSNSIHIYHEDTEAMEAAAGGYYGIDSGVSAAAVLFGMPLKDALKFFIGKGHLPDDGIGPRAEIELARQLREYAKNVQELPGT